MIDPRVKRHPLGYYEVTDKPDAKALEIYYAEKYFQASQGNYRKSYTPEERRSFITKVRQKAQRAREFIECPQGAFLDVGCGEGFAMAYFRQEGWEVEGIDYSSAGLLGANPDLSDALFVGDLTSLLGERMHDRRQYDILWLNNVLEHVADPPELLQGLRALVRVGGILIITVPNDFSWLQQHLLDAGHIKEPFWIALPDHLAYFDRESLNAVANATGWICRDILADFPIDLFLLHNGSNYVRDRQNGPAAHQARIEFENLLGERPDEDVNAFYSALARVGLGRNITAFLTPGSAE